MTEAFVNVYDSSTYIYMSRRNVKLAEKFGRDSIEYETGKKELLNWLNSIEDGCFSFPPDANFVTYDGVDLRFEKLHDCY